jgi:hypothetical protein
MDFFKKLLKKTKLPITNYPVKYAFTISGIDYYEFQDFNNMPALRGIKTMVFYEEMRMKCTMEYLKLHCEAIDDILSAEKINIFEIKKLNDQMKQRISMAVDTELVYKIASVVFFDKKENIQDYDFGYNQKKIDNWKKNKEAAAFFLLKPIQQLVPVLATIGENLPAYSALVEELNKIHLDNLLPQQQATKT